jgi:hypothetical protein
MPILPPVRDLHWLSPSGPTIRSGTADHHGDIFDRHASGPCIILGFCDIQTGGMADKITALRVFIASPSGLQDERRSFRDLLQKYNEAEGLERGVYFVPVGWGAGRE